MDLDYKKVGKFIAQLRKENNMTQDDLAKKIFVERETISKWERGINTPSMEVLLKLCDIFKITINEMILAERTNVNNISKINNVTANILKSNKKFKKNLFFSICTIILLVLTFLLYYFVNNYNSILVYEIEGVTEDFLVDNGIMVVSRDKVYIQLGNVKNLKDLDVVYYELYYNRDDEKRILVSGNDIVNFYVSNYDDSTLEYEDLKYAISNMFIKIDYEDNKSSTIKLNLSRKYSNSNLFYSDNKKLKQDEINKFDDNIPKYIKENFMFNEYENSYSFIEVLDDNDIYHTYYPDANVYIVEEQKNNYSIRYMYSYPDDLSYTKNDVNGNILDEFYYSIKEEKCLSGECQSEIVEYFNKKYLYRINFN